MIEDKLLKNACVYGKISKEKYNPTKGLFYRVKKERNQPQKN